MRKPSASPASKPATSLPTQATSIPATATSAPASTKAQATSAPTKVARRARKKRSLGASLAVLNVHADAGWPVVERARQALHRWIGGWAQQPGVADNLVGKPHPGVLPSNESGQDLGQLLQRLRSSGRPSTSQLWQLGRLLGVDYLVVLHVRKARLSARLFSVQRQRWAPQGFEQQGHDVEALRTYVLDQGRAGQKRKLASSSWRKKWWVWAIAGALAAVTLGFALAEGDSNSGTLRIKVTRP